MKRKAENNPVHSRNEHSFAAPPGPPAMIGSHTKRWVDDGFQTELRPKAAHSQACC